MAAANAKKVRVPELEGIQFNGHKDIKEYSSRLRDLHRSIAAEVEFAAEEVVAVLRMQKGHPLLAGVDTRIRARRVARRLHRVAELNGGAAIEAVKFYLQFRQEFAEVIQPPKAPKARQFDFNDE